MSNIFRRIEVSLSYLRAPPSFVDCFCSAKRWPRNAGKVGRMRVRVCVCVRGSEGSNITHISRSDDYFNTIFNNKYKSGADEVLGLPRDAKMNSQYAPLPRLIGIFHEAL